MQRTEKSSAHRIVRRRKATILTSKKKQARISGKKPIPFDLGSMKKTEKGPGCARTTGFWRGKYTSPCAGQVTKRQMAAKRLGIFAQSEGGESVG